MVSGAGGRLDGFAIKTLEKVGGVPQNLLLVDGWWLAALSDGDSLNNIPWGCNGGKDYEELAVICLYHCWTILIASLLEALVINVVQVWVSSSVCYVSSGCLATLLQISAWNLEEFEPWLFPRRPVPAVRSAFVCHPPSLMPRLRPSL